MLVIIKTRLLVHLKPMCFSRNVCVITIITRAITKHDHTPQQLLVREQINVTEMLNKSGKLSQNTPVLPQVITIQEIS